MSRSTSGNGSIENPAEVIEVEPTDTTETPLVNRQSGLAVLKTPEDMRAAMEVSASRLKVAHDFVDREFVKGIDFGKADPRSDKDSLLKPGAEKLCKLFGTHARWREDLATWKMLGEPAGSACYICEIVSNATGEIVGEGGGVGEVGQQGRDRNKAVKIGRKRALVDAALGTFALSERFTQDQGGGGGKTLLAEGKDLLNETLSQARTGLDSELPDHEFLKQILKSELHKGHIATVGELRHINKVLFEEELYDLGTGKKKRKAKKKAKAKPPEGVDVEMVLKFRQRVLAKRRKLESSLGDEMFISAVIQSEFGKETWKLDDLTREQFDTMGKALADGKYDWITGDLIPDSVGKE